MTKVVKEVEVCPPTFLSMISKWVDNSMMTRPAVECGMANEEKSITAHDIPAVRQVEICVGAGRRKTVVAVVVVKRKIVTKGIQLDRSRSSPGLRRPLFPNAQPVFPHPEFRPHKTASRLCVHDSFLTSPYSERVHLPRKLCTLLSATLFKNITRRPI